MKLGLAVALLLTLLSIPAKAQPANDPGFNEHENSFEGLITDESDQGTLLKEPTPWSDNAEGTGSLFPFLERVLIDDNLGGPGCPAGETRIGTWQVRRVLGPGPDEWEHVAYEYDCSVSGLIPAPVGAAVGSPLDATVHAAIREFLPSPVARLSPEEFGVTGLATWFWFGHDDPTGLTPVDHDGDQATPDVPGMTARASENGYLIAATVWIDEYRWELTDGTVLRSDVPGSADEPAAEFTWTTKDPWNEMTVVASWTGTYTWSAPTGSGSGTMGSLDIATDHAYPIREIRAVPAS